MMKILLLLASLASGTFSEAPYPPSGYRPPGPQFELPKPQFPDGNDDFSDTVIIEKDNSNLVKFQPLITKVEFYQIPIKLFRTETDYFHSYLLPQPPKYHTISLKDYYYYNDEKNLMFEKFKSAISHRKSSNNKPARSGSGMKKEEEGQDSQIMSQPLITYGPSPKRKTRRRKIKKIRTTTEVPIENNSEGIDYGNNNVAISTAVSGLPPNISYKVQQPLPLSLKIRKQ